MGSKSEGSWGARLRTERARTFVGREDALEAGLALLEHPTRRLLHVHGPAGMGKSTVGRALAARARESGHAVRLVDALDARGSLASLSDALAGPWDLLILDSLGALGALESWLRESFLPSLPDHARVVTLGRRPLSPPWVNDRGWRALATQHRLEP
ncbi:MAG TPA: ATP-binding protein, partial [Polyangiaceae bacterium LLY-WYZ-15_(1-7)]|nr:ATP-binding protein [Polyangiaceae bacterium LLY-WYZ-15_(1-7)]HJL22654.1 ATP-binding protein [Polyangiaceae bacterium LLY-WYZ-15_(1-7)]